jgi:hypothetical protein
MQLNRPFYKYKLYTSLELQYFSYLKTLLDNTINNYSLANMRLFISPNGQSGFNACYRTWISLSEFLIFSTKNTDSPMGA